MSGGLAEWTPSHSQPPRPSLAPPHTCSHQVADHLGGPPPQALTSAGNPCSGTHCPGTLLKECAQPSSPGRSPFPSAPTASSPVLTTLMSALIKRKCGICPLSWTDLHAAELFHLNEAWCCAWHTVGASQTQVEWRKDQTPINPVGV